MTCAKPRTAECALKRLVWLRNRAVAPVIGARASKRLRTRLISLPAGAIGPWQPIERPKLSLALRGLCWFVAVLSLGQCAQGADLNGRKIAHDVFRGNCLACHQIPGDRSAVSLADIGPVLSHMRQRFPDRATLRAQIWDSTVRNPLTVMPPFGRHKVL